MKRKVRPGVACAPKWDTTTTPTPQKPPQCDIKASSKRVDSQAIATPKPPQSLSNTTPKQAQSHSHATQGDPKAIRVGAMPKAHFGCVQNWKSREVPQLGFRSFADMRIRNGMPRKASSYVG